MGNFPAKMHRGIRTPPFSFSYKRVSHLGKVISAQWEIAWWLHQAALRKGRSDWILWQGVRSLDFTRGTYSLLLRRPSPQSWPSFFWRAPPEPRWGLSTWPEWGKEQWNNTRHRFRFQHAAHLWAPSPQSSLPGSWCKGWWRRTTLGLRRAQGKVRGGSTGPGGTAGYSLIKVMHKICILKAKGDQESLFLCKWTI